MTDAESSLVARTLSGRTSRRAALGGAAGGGIAALLAPTMLHRAAAQESGGATDWVSSTEQSPSTFRLDASEPQEFAGGTLRTASPKQIPIMSGLSINRLDINAGAIRELHWHSNAGELSYCLAGEGTIGIVPTSGNGDPVTFAIKPGSITYIPVGAAHYIRNSGAEQLQLIVTFSNAEAGHLDFSQMLPWVPGDLLSQTLGVAPGTFPILAPGPDRTIALIEPEATASSASSTPFSVQLDDIEPQLFDGGTVQPVRVSALPTLADMTLLVLDIDPYGLREPHWHGNAAELNYCARGRAQIGIVAPSGASQTVLVEQGDIAYIPANWFHYIVSVSDEPLQFLAFFDNIAPNRIDLSTMTDYFPPDVLAASFGIDPAVFASLPKRGNIVIANALPPVDANIPEAVATPSL